MGKQKRKKRPRRQVSEPEISPEQIDAWNRRSMVPVGGAMGLGLGLVVAFNLYQTQGPLLAIGAGLVIAAVTWFGFWVNYGRRR